MSPPPRITDAASTRDAWSSLAERALAGDQPVPSPCVNVCRMNAQSAWCEGCWRSIDEIAAWSRLDEAARRALWPVLLQRRGQAAPDPV